MGTRLAMNKTAREHISIPVCMVGEPEEVLDRYRDLIEQGQSPGMASILATRQAPGLETATNHFVGMKSLKETCGADYDALMRNLARKAGIPVNEHSRYNGTVADHRRGGDPDAWIHNGESPDKWRKVCEKRGMSSEDLRTRDDGRIHEIEAKREQRINKQKRERAAREEFISDRKKKIGVPE